MSWTDEEREQAINAYKEANPTSENSMEIVAEIAEEMEKPVNSVRMILMRADVYVKKTPTSTKSSGGGGSKRVSKEEAQTSLANAISAKGLEPDMDIISKLTGKAAVYLTDVVSAE